MPFHFYGVKPLANGYHEARGQNKTHCKGFRDKSHTSILPPRWIGLYTTTGRGVTISKESQSMTVKNA
jgi:hypothetical protein